MAYYLFLICKTYYLNFSDILMTHKPPSVTKTNCLCVIHYVLTNFMISFVIQKSLNTKVKNGIE
jgi:hypothetical protein